MEHVSLLSSEPTTVEQLKVFCKPTYQMRKLRNKGAILVLIWSYLVMSVFIYLYSYAKHGGKLRLMVLGLSLPFAGWLADILFGRYKVMYCSMWIMWVSSILTTASSVSLQLVDNNINLKINYYTSTVLMVIMAVGFGGYQANVIQFAMDQLYDASTNEIKSFITWYAWIIVGGGIVEHLAVICINENYHIFRLLIICTFLSLALVLNAFYGHLLVKEPVSNNPFKLVYKVIKYAIKTKHPRCRSAFTYCEESLPSRIDFGKRKYGGPFTTEQVEDVKTFLQLLPALVIGCACGGVVIANHGIEWYQLNLLLRFPIKHYKVEECYLETLFLQAFYYSAVLMIPLHEFILYPILHKCFIWVKFYWKFVIGVMIQVAKIMSLMLIQVVARYNFQASRGYNDTVECMFYESRSILSSSLDYRWMAVPNFLHSISMSMMFVGGIEFLCAQVPYSMKGLIFGATYGLGVISTVIVLALSFLFKKRLFIWSTGIISCGFWYFLLVLVIIIIISCVGFVVFKLYKNRRREDVLPNEQIFAERYYTKDY